MVEQVDVYVENLLEGDIEVCREHEDGTCEPSIKIPGGEVDRFFLPEPGVLLVIGPPNGMDIKLIPFKLTKNKHLISWSIRDDHWIVQIAHNDMDPEVPSSVYVTVGPFQMPT